MEKKKEPSGKVDADVLEARDAVKAAMKGKPVDKDASRKKADKTESKASHEEKATGADAGANKKPENAEGAIPRLNLGEKILAEQRQASSTRRQKARPAASEKASYPARDTVGAIIRESKGQASEAKGEGTPKEASPETGRSIMIDDDYLNDSQRQLVAEIVSRDILALCG